VRIPVDGLPYPIIVSDAAPAEVAAIAQGACNAAVVISDRKVASRGEAVAEALQRSGTGVLAVLCIDAGERRKRWKAVAGLHTALLASGAERSSFVIAIGGGTLTDVVGFAAATFMRGLPWLAVPTTVLGMVDASIGGKTGVDLPEGKNLIGAFWQPAGVVADLAALETLPAADRRTGMAEIVKTAVACDPSLLDAAERFDIGQPPADWARIVAQSAAAKAQVVARDPCDRGARAALNLGHTFAHAIERASNYRIGHGAAVALGLRAAGVLARERTGWSHADHRRVLRALRRAGLRVRATALAGQPVLDAMRSDKKRRDGSVRFVLPVRLGEVEGPIEMPESAVRDALAALQTLPVRGAW